MAHSVAQVQLAPTGLKSICSPHYQNRKSAREREREKEMGQRKEREQVRAEGRNAKVNKFFTASKLTSSYRHGGGREMGIKGGHEEKRAILHVFLLET